MKRENLPDIKLPHIKAREDVARKLLHWYGARRRDLPWRRSRDPYAIWVSEMMLQQTQVATALPYFERWMQRFPDLRTLAAADEHDVLQLWQGLGYYSRARHLLRGAQMVVEDHGGQLPRDVTALRSLPGIGPYTAGAIASIAYDQDEPLVDGNVIRVLCRLFALAGDPGRVPLRKQLWDLARALLPSGRAGDFNQALMELGAMVCKPGTPSCGQCPVADLCLAVRRTETDRFPELPGRTKATRVVHVAALVECEKRVLVVRQSKSAPRWSSLWMLPWVERDTQESESAAAVRAVVSASGLDARDEGPLQDLKHSVTRFRIHLKLRQVRLVSPSPVARGGSTEPVTRWCSREDLEDLAMPAAHRKLVRTL